MPRKEPLSAGGGLSRRLKPLWTALIVAAIMATGLFSGQNGAQSDGLSTALARWILNLLRVDYDRALFNAFHHFLRKAAHFTLYFLLGCGLAGMLYSRGRRITFAGAVTAAALYAAADEFHQSLSAGRHPSLWDVALDTAGAAVGSAVVILALFLLDRRAGNGGGPVRGPRTE